MKNANYKNIGYSLCNELRKDDDRQEGWKQQRAERGFDNTELWNLDVTIAKFLVPRLKAAKESYGLDDDIMDWEIFTCMGLMFRGIVSKLLRRIDMENESCKDLASYIKRNFVYISWGEFEGMNTEPTMQVLMTLKGFVENAIWEKLKESK